MKVNDLQIVIAPISLWQRVFVVFILIACGCVCAISIARIARLFNLNQRFPADIARPMARYLIAGIYLLVLGCSALLANIVFKEGFLRYRIIEYNDSSAKFLNDFGFKIVEIPIAGVGGVEFIKDGRTSGFIEVKTVNGEMFRSVRCSDSNLAKEIDAGLRR